MQTPQEILDGQRTLQIGDKCYVRDVKGFEWNDWYIGKVIWANKTERTDVVEVQYRRGIRLFRTLSSRYYGIVQHYM